MIWEAFANRLIFPESDAAGSGRWSSVFRVAVEKRLGLDGFQDCFFSLEFQVASWRRNLETFKSQLEQLNCFPRGREHNSALSLSEFKSIFFYLTISPPPRPQLIYK